MRPRRAFHGALAVGTALALVCAVVFLARRLASGSDPPAKWATLQMRSLREHIDAYMKEAPACRVVKVVDGDTVVVLLDDRRTTVRLIGVDTPETRHPEKTVQPYGPEAARFAENLLKGESVYLDYEPGASRTNKYGHTLAYVYRAPDGLFVNLEIVRQGYGRAYMQYPFQHMEWFRFYERTAREAKKGLWSEDVTPARESPTLPVPPPVIQKKSPSRAEEADDPTMYITRTGTRYHAANCPHLAKSKIRMRLSEAKQKGYQPCTVCEPPR